MRANPVRKRGGNAVNSSQARRDSGKKPYHAPTQKKHPYVAAREEALCSRFGKKRAYKECMI